MKKKLNFRSGFEEKVYENAVSSGRELDYEPENPVVRYVVPARYLPDFRLPNGVLVECKGYFDGRARAKMSRIKRDNPSLDIRFLFQRANNHITKSKNSLQYWQWAERHGFKWAEGTSIPQEWWDEPKKENNE